MGSFASEVLVVNANGIVFHGGSIVFVPGDANYDAGAVANLSNGQTGSFWVSNTNQEVYLSRSSGNTTILGITAI